MKFTTVVKTLTLLGLTSLTLAAAPSQADNGFVYFGTNPGGYPAANPAANPWLAGPAYQQARYVASMKERQAQMDQHMDAQLQRIIGGIENGRLTARESVGLLREHLAISSLERNYMADGRLGPGELANLEQRLAEADRHIVFEKNDRDVRGPIGAPPMGAPMDRPGDGYRR
jgi:hypothetical protein